jgi:phytanoyl-CoA hydroxylase
VFTENDIDDIRLKYETQGFVHLKGVIPPDTLARARAAFDAAAERSNATRQKSAGTNGPPRFFDIPDILDQDPVFVELVDLQSIFPVLVAAIGSDIQLNHTMARLFYPGPTFTGPWHSDIPQMLGVDHGAGTSILVKAHFFVEDLAPDQGCLAFIPGSHRYPAGHPKPKIRDIDASEVVVKTVPCAGDVVIFNTHVMHMATDNRSSRVRKSIIYAYSHYWMKNYASGVPSDLERYATTAQRKQLFGVDIEGVQHIDRRLDGNTPIQLHSALFNSSKRVLKRILKRA